MKTVIQTKLIVSLEWPEYLSPYTDQSFGLGRIRFSVSGLCGLT